jgi:glycosyltransferase involved in cell wall biosynthesis
MIEIKEKSFLCDTKPSDTISVAICTYNGEKYISEQLYSILNQSLPPNEIIICDDRSTDSTVKICKKILKESNINYKIIVNEENLGFIKNFEKAIKLCSGDIIFLSDQDDVWIDSKVEQILKAFRLNENCMLVFSDALLVDSNLKSLNMTVWGQAGIDNNLISNKEKLFERILFRNFISGSALAFKKDLVDFFLPIPTNYIHDYWIALLAILYGNVVGVNESLIYYRQHGGNALGIQRKSTIKTITKSLKNINFSEIITKYEQLLVLKNKIETHKLCLDSSEYRLITSKFNYFSNRRKIESMSLLEGIKIICQIAKRSGYRKFGVGKQGRSTIAKDVILLIFARKRGRPHETR